MLPRKNRLVRATFPTSRPLKRVQYSWGSISLYPEKPGFKASVVVSKKTLPRAVDRNRATRRAYAALRKVFETRASNTVAVVFPKKEVLIVPFGLMVEDLKKALF